MKSPAATASPSRRVIIGDPPLKPGEGANAEHERREPTHTKREIDDIEHENLHSCPNRQRIACTPIKALYGRLRRRIKIV